jgi:hypothetical protein
MFHLGNLPLSSSSWLVKLYQFFQMFLAQANVVANPAFGSISTLVGHIAFLATFAQTMGIILCANLSIMILYYVFKATEIRINRMKGKIAQAYGRSPVNNGDGPGKFQDIKNMTKLYFLKGKRGIYNLFSKPVPAQLDANINNLTPKQNAQVNATSRRQAHNANEMEDGAFDEVMPFLDDQMRAQLSDSPDMLNMYNETLTLVQEYDGEIATLSDIASAIDELRAQRETTVTTALTQNSFDELRNRLRQNLRINKPEQQGQLDELLVEVERLIVIKTPSSSSRGGKRGKQVKKCVKIK